MKRSQRKICLSLGVGVCALSVHGIALAQDTQAETPANGGLTDIVVTAQKRGVAERAQAVPIAITALNAEAIQRLNVRDLSSLTTSIPNVSLESSGLVNGQANFEIRGFGISGSSPSLEPAVGVFIDGVYQGQTFGVLTDMFDVQSVEVLRGPQGTLFGRNTTGGAVSIQTKRPGSVFALNGKLSLESGPSLAAAASIEGPLAGDSVRAKLTGYYAYDDGYFFNRFSNSRFGKSRTYFFRPTLVWDITPNLDQTIIAEYGQQSGDGPATSNTETLNGFTINIDSPGITDITWKRLTSETNFRIALGDGVITNVAGWGEVDNQSGTDTDGRPILYFNINSKLHQRQFSEELRFAGKFGPVDLTIGGYYFNQRYSYVESRDISTSAFPIGLGGNVEQHSLGGFGQAQLHLTSKLSIIAGGRYSWEKKQAQIATINAAAPRCTYATEVCSFNFPGPTFADPGTRTWSHFSPKLGFQWRMTDASQIYGNYSQGVRSGGYSVRVTTASVSPVYDQEIQDAFELGAKTDLLDHHLRINVAGFYNRIDNLQRDIATPDPLVGSAQITSNVGTSEIYGAEAEITAALTREFQIGVHGGYLHGKYLTLTADLNGTLPGLGYELALVRLPEFSYGATASYRRELNDGSHASIATQFGHVDASAALDNNLSFLRERNNWDAQIAYELPDQRMTLSFYAKNLLDNLTWSQASTRSAAQGGGIYVPLNKGRILGASLAFKFN